MKQLIAILFILVSSLTFGQKEKYLIDFKILKIIYQGDSVMFDKPHPVEINLSKVSHIVEIGQINGMHLGVKFEILKSDLDEGGSFIAGRIYYIKTANDWEEISQFGHSTITLEVLSQKKGNDKELEKEFKSIAVEEKQQLLTSSNSEIVGGDPVIFGIYYRIHFYVK